MADGSPNEGLAFSVILIGLLILLATVLFFLLFFYWFLRAKITFKTKTKSERKTKTTSNQARLRRSSKTEVHLKGKPRSVRTDAKPDSSQKELPKEPPKESPKEQPKEQPKEPPKEHSHRDRPHKEHSHKEHKDQMIKELFQKEPDTSLDPPHKAVPRMKSLKKIETDSPEKVREVASTIDEESKLGVQEQSKASTALDRSDSSLKLGGTVHVELPYSDTQTARSTVTSGKMDSEYLGNLNALGGNDSFSSSVKRDLHETLYNQNISLFSIKNGSVGENSKKDPTSTLSSFKFLNTATKKI